MILNMMNLRCKNICKNIFFHHIEHDENDFSCEVDEFEVVIALSACSNVFFCRLPICEILMLVAVL